MDIPRFVLKERNVTCEEYKDCELSCPLLEKDICHYLYQGPTGVGTHNGHLSAFQGMIGFKCERGPSMHKFPWQQRQNWESLLKMVQKARLIETNYVQTQRIYLLIG